MTGPIHGMEKWIERELIKVNRGLVTRRRSLRKLLEDDEPRCVTRDGTEHRFDKLVLERFAMSLLEGEDVLLPVTISFSSTLKDSCYISDEVASTILRRIEGFGEAYPFRDGKMWLPNSLGYSILQKYPAIFQAMFL